MLLDDFISEQKIASKMLKNAIIKGKCSHAYLFETNNYNKSMEFVLSFAKALLCPKQCTNNKNCLNCNQCQIIDDNNFLELKIISTDGEWIKKEQLDQLQNMFSKKAVIGNKKVYIIDSVEKLNVSSSNSILKFLEEPENGIYALLITNNINSVISTIISRCQIIRLKNNNSLNNDDTFISKIAKSLYNSEDKIKSFISDDNSEILINTVINFVDLYENAHLDAFFEVEQNWNNVINERTTLTLALKIMLLYYKDILNYKRNLKLEIFDQYKDKLRNISIKSSDTILLKKIYIIIDLLDKIKYNININLLMDKLIIEFEGCEENG